MYLLKLILVPFAWILPILIATGSYRILWTTLFPATEGANSGWAGLSGAITGLVCYISAGFYTGWVFSGEKSAIGKYLKEHKPVKELTGLPWQPGQSDWR